jgi:acetylornithine deacetylase/succinyl-diaminopimelate desuccinylase-like protein
MPAAKYVPDRDIIVALTADEEGGPANGVDWLLKNHRPLIDAEFAFNERNWRVRGLTITDTMKVSHDVQAGERFLNRFEVPIPAAWLGAAPDNAIAARRRAHEDQPDHVPSPQRGDRVFTRLAGVVHRKPRGVCHAVIVANLATTEGAPVLSAITQLAARTSVPTISGGTPQRVPQRRAANVNFRILPGETPEQVRGLERVVEGRQDHVPGQRDQLAAVAAHAGVDW